MIYAKFLKRMLDFLLSTIALVVLSPIIVLLILIGAVAVKGNPFFIQNRPGRNEKIFKLIKFRTMTNEKDVNGEFLSDDVRLIPYGRFLRKTRANQHMEGRYGDCRAPSITHKVSPFLHGDGDEAPHSKTGPDRSCPDKWEKRISMGFEIGIGC